MKVFGESGAANLSAFRDGTRISLGKPQTELAAALRRSKASITGMLERLRKQPLDDRERRAVDGILEGDV